MTTEITTNKEAMTTLNRASCVTLTLEQLVRHCQFEEPICSAALSETLTIVYDLINEAYNYLDRCELEARRA